MSKTGKQNSKPEKLSYTEQIKKYEDSIAPSPLIPSSFKETTENLLNNVILEDITSLLEESNIDINSKNLFDVVMAKIKNVELLQAANSENIKLLCKNKQIYTKKAELIDLVHKYTESIEVEEIKNAVRSNKIFQK